MSAPATNQMITPTSAASAAPTVLYPSTQTMMQAAKFAIEQDRAIMLDYYNPSHAGTAFLGVDPNTNERILIKNKQEFTSLVSKLLKTGEDLLVPTENSLYIISNKIQKRNVDLAALHEAYDA
jgi:ABC-type proline/glycine betaine transport system substrate-binding protein